MASAEFLEEALNTNVDESAVNAIVGSLETQLVTSSSGQIINNQNNLNKVLSNGNLNMQNQVATNVMNSQINSEANKMVTSNSYNSNSPQIITSNVPIGQIQGRVQGFVGQMPNSSQGNLTLVQNIKGQDQVKLSYPQTSQPNSGQATVLSNRVIYPAQSLPNRTIALAPFTQNVLQAGAPGSIVTQTMGKPLQINSPFVIKQGTNMNQVGIKPGLVTVPMTNTTMGGTIPVEIVNKNMGPNIVTTQAIVGGNPHGTLPANVQIVNMRPGTPVGGQKSVAAVSPRVVIGPPQVLGGGARPSGPGITLQTLQGLQPGQQGHLLLKTENGQFQLLRVGPPGPGAATGQAIRLTTVNAQANNSPMTVMSGTTLPNSQSLQQSSVNAPMQQQTMQTTLMSGTPIQQQVRVQQGTVLNQRTSVDNLKEKCRKFLSNLLDLSSKEPKTVERNVRILIQELIDARVEPDAFCQRLEKLLDASPQPCLIGFLKKTLPILRQSLVNKELVIDGIHPPPLNVVYSTVTTSSSPTVQNVQTSISQTTVSSGTLPPLQTPIRTITQQQSMSMPAPAPVVSKPPTPLRQITKAQTQNASKTFIKVSSNVPSSPGPSSINKQILKDKEKKSLSAPSFSQSSFSDIDKMAGDDDINDVAAMGGVNLAEESQKILRSTEMIGTQIRSCKDEYLASMGPLQARLKQIAAKHGLDEPSFDVSALMSHALQERLKNLIEKLACIAEHRLDIIKLIPNYEVTQDVKGQLKFLEELDRVERRRREEYEREILLRAAKSRSKTEDPEQAKLKEKAKEMQRAEMEEMRQREANLTALQAIGPRKKPRIGMNQNDSLGSMDSNMMDISMGSKNGVGRTAAPLRARMKRVNYRDLLFLLEQERDTVRSQLLYKCYLK